MLCEKLEKDIGCINVFF